MAAGRLIASISARDADQTGILVLPVLPTHICLLQVPAPGDEAWRHAIAAACQRRDWDYYEQFDDAPLQMDPTRNGVLVTWALYTCPTDHPTWIVQSCEPALAIETLEQRYSFSRAEAELHASGRFADIVGLLEGGATVADRSASLEVGDMGSVERPEGTPEVKAAAPDSLLSMYGTLLAPARVEINCPLDRLTLHSESIEATVNGPTLWLVGRRRILVQGPDIWGPPGRWSAEIEFVINAPVAVTLGFEWGRGETIQEVFSNSGRYVVELASERAEKILLDLRVSLLVPVLNGHLTVTALRMRRT